MDKNRRIKTVLYGDQRFSDEELDILHTPALQRLYDLHQLGFTDRIFVDASHSRLHHVIGVVEQVTIIMDALSNNLKSESSRGLRYWSSNTESYVEEQPKVWSDRVTDSTPVARLMGLLHDLTHAPFGHTLEDEIGLVEEKHDEPRRQAESFLRLIVQYISLGLKNHGVSDADICKPIGSRLSAYLRRPDLEELELDSADAKRLGEYWGDLLFSFSNPNYEYPFQTLSRKKLVEFLVQLRKAMIALLYLDIAHKDTWKATEKILPQALYPFQQLIDSIIHSNKRAILPEEEFLPQRDCFLLDVIGNTICADLLDYAKRDSASAGLKLDYDAGRIVDNFTLVTEDSPMDLEVRSNKDTPVLHPFRGIRIRTAIKLFSQKLRTDVPGELLNLLQVRYYVYERMLFHPTKCVVGAMLGAALQLTGIRRLPNHHRYVGDQVFLNQILEGIQITYQIILEESTSPLLGIDESARSEMQKRLLLIPKTGSTMTAKSIIESIVVERDVIKRKLKIIRKFPNLSNVCASLTKLLNDNERIDYDRNTLKALVDQIIDDKANKSEVLDRICPTKAGLLSNLSAATDIMERITARRYFKRVFRLLPNVELDSIAVQGELPVQSIASTFLDPFTRHETERRIEKECGFPLGSIVLHCPPATGPTKIAKIYVTDGATWKKAYLRDIGKIDGNIFLEHQKAVHALEEMYRSTWRLIVSVAPPHTRDWEKASGKIGTILRGIMAGGPIVDIFSFKNDEYMERELKAAEVKLGKEADSGKSIEKTVTERTAPKAALITKKRMGDYSAQFYDKLRTQEEREQLKNGLEEIRLKVNGSAALTARFSALETTSFFGIDQDELFLANQNLKPQGIINYINEFFGIEPS